MVNSKLLVPEKAGLFHGIADVENKKIGFATKVLLFRDGRDWHFDDSGNLVAQVDGPSTVIYRRTNAHSVARIEGWYGKNLLADVRIDYDKQGRLISAQGSNGNAVKYTYNKAGTLISVEGPNSIIGYQYKDELVRTITQN
ncbi:MAG: hypothetical protein GWO10_25465, partial [candidate division Zixibacteria bacterium]|nr:hypothetical protein [candidate division Zixibacteria bacterium]NIX01570.1 hypothetical protein [Phycisphaerae bacterium]